jgi:hypothetical protein
MMGTQNMPSPAGSVPGQNVAADETNYLILGDCFTIYQH